MCAASGESSVYFAVVCRGSRIGAGDTSRKAVAVTGCKPEPPEAVVETVTEETVINQ